MPELKKVSYEDDFKQLSYDFEKQEIQVRVQFAVTNKDFIHKEDLLTALRDLAIKAIQEMRPREGFINFEGGSSE